MGKVLSNNAVLGKEEKRQNGYIASGCNFKETEINRFERRKGPSFKKYAQKRKVKVNVFKCVLGEKKVIIVKIVGSIRSMKLPSSYIVISFPKIAKQNVNGVTGSKKKVGLGVFKMLRAQVLVLVAEMPYLQPTFLVLFRYLWFTQPNARERSRSTKYIDAGQHSVFIGLLVGFGQILGVSLVIALGIGKPCTIKPVMIKRGSIRQKIWIPVEIEIVYL